MRLLFHQTALGDFAVVLPMLRAMAAAGPTSVVAPWSRIELATTFIPGLRGMDIELFEFSRLHVPGGPAHLSPLVAKAFAAAELIVSFIATDEQDWSANVRRLAPDAKLVCVPPIPPSDWAEPAAAYHAAVLDRAGVADLYAPAPTVDLHHAEGPIVVHPGSGSVAKQWPLDRFEALIDRLHAAQPDRAIRVIAGEAEIDRWSPGTLEHWQDRHHLIECRTAAGLLDALRDAAVYIGNDAGPTHVAAQAGLPTVVLFGPSDPGVWCPVGPRVTALTPETSGAMDWLEVDAVEAVVAELLAGQR
ncbi:MAG: glycosyltransferase family 9 protein [Planctomycetota bacterium]